MKREFLEELGIDEEAVKSIMAESEKGEKELLKEIERLREEAEAAEKRHSAQISEINKSNAVDNALSRAGAKTLKAVRALLDMESVEIDENGNVTGLDEQLSALIKNEETSYLFERGESFKGVLIGNSEEENLSVEDMNYSQLCAYFENN